MSQKPQMRLLTSWVGRRKRKSRGRLVMVKKKRNSKKTGELMKMANAKFRGHYNYFGYWCNRNHLQRYYHESLKALFNLLNRRSQKKSLNYERFKLSIMQRLIAPPEVVSLRELGWNPYA